MKKLLVILLVIAITLSVPMPVFANENSINGIRSLEVKADLVKYANNVFPKHLHALLENDELIGSLDNYSIGEPFTVFNVIENTNSTCFPVLLNKNIVSIFEVTENMGEFSSSLSISFARELENFMNTNKMKDFVLLTDGVHLQAFDGKNCVEIFKLYNDGNEVGKLSSVFKIPLSSLSKISSYNELKTEFNNSDYLDIDIHPTGVDGPTSYKTLRVQGVSQGIHPWCWAATCAAIINYLKGESLSASDVANYVFPDNPEQRGNWSDIKKAYNHWGLYPSQTGVISFDEVKRDIDSYNPMHLGLRGHSVGLIGYEDWTGSYGRYNDKILILLEPNGGVHRSVTLNSSGNFTYSLGGGSNAWVYTRRF